MHKKIRKGMKTQFGTVERKSFENYWIVRDKKGRPLEVHENKLKVR